MLFKKSIFLMFRISEKTLNAFFMIVVFNAKLRTRGYLNVRR